MACWFSSKWSVPYGAYYDSMEQSLKNGSPVPRWYAALDGDRIVAGMGVIENDFHVRPDLTPNVCAVYTEPDCRCRGLAGRLLDFVVQDMEKENIKTLYLVTDHDAFYERYGWALHCMVKCEDGGTSRLYIHTV